MNRQPKFSLFEGCLSMTVALTIDDSFEVTNAIVWPLVFVELQLNYSNYSCILTTEVFSSVWTNIIVLFHWFSGILYITKRNLSTVL